ncbi:GlxA family transcriptional regulator [Amycolatopsis solani]|uniref:GlxA family transcriptional regulator n=1 Tax=Amycolatopsis solani TaxID=3028615 RepID=UPI0025B0AFCA|nr:helix-turn-helix domain-containing protein [Amycolatopsis sp. MEP2-6]
MSRDSYQPVPVGLLLDEGSNPFEFACVCEVFGARRRPEIGRELYTLQVIADEFRRRFPTVDLREDLLYVDDGSVLTSAGSAAALDLAPHLVRADHGAEIANAVSRRLIFSTYREGGQKQFVEKPVPEARQQSLSDTLAWARERLDTPLTVNDLAAHACQSVTTFHRRFRTELGTTPLAWLNLERAELARRLLETGSGGLDHVAARSGLGTASNLRRLIRRSTGLTPSQYRSAYLRTAAR